MSILIGLAGPMGSGKDTLGILLGERFQEVWIVKFADKLYKMAAAVDPVFSPSMSHAQKDGFLLDNPSLGTRRNFLEKLGTDFGRDLIAKDLWITLTIQRLEAIKALADNPVIVVTDVRTDNEAELIRQRGGLVFKLVPDWPSAAAPSTHKITRPLLYNPADIELRLIHNNPKDAVDRIIYEMGKVCY